MSYLLFEFNKAMKCDINFLDGFNINVFTPKIWRLYEKNENRDFRTTLFRTYISMLTLNKTKVYFVTDKNNKIVHTSYTIRKNFKYPFMKKNEILVGPCNTVKEYRGRGIYPYVLNYIIRKTDNKSYYLIIKSENSSSINGAKKAGFSLTPRKIKKTKILKRFIEIEN